MHKAVWMSCLVLFYAAAAAGSTYDATGPARVEVRDTAWTDTARNRPLPLRIRLPDAATSPGKRAAILFSHGLGGSIHGGTRWGEHWASHGFVVIHIEHPGSNLESILQGNTNAELDRARRARAAANGEQLIDRVRDVAFVLDEIARRQAAGDPIAERIDLARVGVAGHSFGASTAQALAGQNYPKHGPAPLADARPKAFVAFSPAARSNDDPKAFDGIKRPFFGLTGTEDGMVGPGVGVPPAQRLLPFARMPAGDKYLLNLQGADHMIFAGQGRRPALTNYSGKSAKPEPARDAEHERLIRGLTTAFWLAYLDHNAPALIWLKNGRETIGSAGEFHAK
jgi:predicted dienelactone hydrolase